MGWKLLAPLSLKCYSRFHTLTGDPYAALSFMPNINRMPALYSSKRPSKNSFQTLIDLINQGTFCMSKESIWQIISPDFCLTFLLQRGISVMFYPTGQEMIEKTFSPLEYAFCIGKMNTFDCTVSQHHTLKEKQWSRFKQISWKQIGIINVKHSS